MAEEKEKKTESHGKFSFVSSLNHVLETRFGNALNNLFSFYQSLFFNNDETVVKNTTS